MVKRRLIVVAVIVCLVLTKPPVAHADLIRGIMRVVGGVFEIPKDVLTGTFGGPPIVGTIAGALTGTLRGAAMVVSGALETVISAIPLAAKAAPWIPVFL